MFKTSRVCRTIASAVAVALAVGVANSAAAAEAQDPDGFYIGVGLGQFDVTVDNLDAAGDLLKDLDADDASWKLVLGWRINPYIAFEADYVDLGAPSGGFDATGSSGQYELDFAGFAAYAIGSIPLGIFELSAKIGYYFHDVDVHVDFDNFGPNNGNVINSESSGEAFTYGIGAGVTFLEHLNAKIEYEVFDLEKTEDANALWLTGTWRF